MVRDSNRPLTDVAIELGVPDWASPTRRPPLNFALCWLRGRDAGRMASLWRRTAPPRPVTLGVSRGLADLSESFIATDIVCGK